MAKEKKVKVLKKEEKPYKKPKKYYKIAFIASLLASVLFLLATIAAFIDGTDTSLKLFIGVLFCTLLAWFIYVSLKKTYKEATKKDEEKDIDLNG